MVISIKIWLHNWWRFHMCNVHNILPKQKNSQVSTVYFSADLLRTAVAVLQFRSVNCVNLTHSTERAYRVLFSKWAQKSTKMVSTRYHWVSLKLIKPLTFIFWKYIWFPVTHCHRIWSNNVLVVYIVLLSSLLLS